MFMRYFLLLLFYSIILCDTARGVSPCQKGYKTCADSFCCCKTNIAVCKNNGPRLTFIPKLPNNTENLNFQGNFLPAVNVTTFKNLTHLNISKLELNFNKIVNISEDAFSVLPSLRELSIDGNKQINLSQLTVAFGSIQRTGNITITLRYSDLTDVQSGLLKHLTNAYLSKLLIDHNQLIALDFKAFEDLPYLQKLSVTENRIRDIFLGNGHQTLDELNLSGNEIARHLPKFCTKNQTILLFPNLTHLDLSKNFISELNSESWDCLKRLQFLSLAGNVVRKVPTNVFSSLTNLYKLNFGEMSGNLQTIQKYAFNNSRLQSLNMQQNAITFSPSLSFDIFGGLPNLRKLLISDNNLHDFSEADLVRMLSPLANLEELHAVKCKIKHLPTGIFNVLSGLKRVIMDQNHIEALGGEFTLLTNLTYLSLQSNRIRVVDREHFPTHIPPSLQAINLAFNPFDCTCELLWFRNSISDDGKIGNVALQSWPGLYTCVSPSLMKSKRLIYFHPTAFECKNILLIILLSVASLLLSVTVLAIVSYRYRWNIQLWFYRMKPRKKDTERQPLLDGPSEGFRGYVIYDIEDRCFVHNDLRILVEEKMQYKLKIWGRDGGMGGAELEDMADSIYDSEHVIAVLSKVSLANEWVRFQIDVALHRKLEIKRNNLMLVLLGDIDFAALSKHWCAIFTRLPTARWCEDDTDIKRRVFEQQLLQHLGVEMKPTV